MNSKFVQIWIGTSAILAIMIGPFLVRGDQNHSSQRTEHIEIIEQMSPSQRDQLERNFASYEKMTPAERQRLERFHYDLRADQLKHKGELTSVMETYNKWFRSLEQYQRDRLMQEPDSQKRIALMREILDDKKTRDATRRVQFFWSFRGPRDEHDRHSGHALGLDSETFNRLITGLYEVNSRRFTATERQEINSLSGLNRLVRLLKILDEKSSGGPPPNSPDRTRVKREFHQPFEDLAERFDEYVEDSDARDFMSSAANRIEKIERLAMMFVVNSMRHFSRIQDPPERQSIKEYYDSLEDARKDELLRFSAVDFYETLEFESQQSDDSANTREYHAWDVPNEIFEKRNWGRGPGSPPFGGGRGGGDRHEYDDGPRSGFRGNDEGRRPDDFPRRGEYNPGRPPRPDGPLDSRSPDRQAPQTKENDAAQDNE